MAAAVFCYSRLAMPRDLTSAELLDCHEADDPLAAMRAKSAEEILAAAAKGSAKVHSRAIVDGWVFPDEIFNIYASGQQNRVA